MEAERSGLRNIRLILAVLTVALVVVLLMSSGLVYRIATDQTEELGHIRLQNIAAGLQQSLLRAENSLLDIGEDLEQMLTAGASEEEIRAFLSERASQEYTQTNGVCINVFCVVDGVVMISDIDTPQDYILQDRMWYRGLLVNRDLPFYISPVYEAAFTPDGVCFTIVRFLDDGQTIVGMDYSAAEIQGCIAEMVNDRYGEAVIVDENEIIVGHTDETLVGQKLSVTLPQFRDIFQVATDTRGSDANLQRDINGTHHNFFSSRTDNGWYLMCCIEGDPLYQHTYGSLRRNIYIALVLIVAIVVCSMLNWYLKRRAQTKLVEQSRFILKLYDSMVKPLQRLRELLHDEENAVADDPATNAKIREVGHTLAAIFDNLTGDATRAAAASPARLTKEERQAQRQAERRSQQLDENDPEGKTAAKQRKYQVMITVIFLVTMVIAISISTSMTINESRLRMDKDLKDYHYSMRSWVQEQKSVLTMFENIIISKPEMLDDYDGMVGFLNDVVQHYPGISAAFIANPNFEHGHSMVMNNGWIPGEDYRVEERTWYTGALTATGISISAPFYDVRTGEYCITFSKVVRSADGEFYGVFGLDYYLDVLATILEEHRSANEYAFLVDKNGFLLDHPNAAYNFSSNVRNLVYGKVYRQSGMSSVRDYDGKYKVCSAIDEPESGFRIFVVKTWGSVYSNILRYLFLYLVLFGLCILVVNLVIHGLILWQRRTNESLQETANSAIRAERAKLQFLSNISHELRTPINAVLGMNEMILRESHDEHLRTYAQNIQSSGKTLLFLINDILDMSKIESGKMKIVPVNYAPGELFMDLWNVIYLRAQGKGLSISFAVDANTPRVLFGDDVRIKQIVTNILTNAVKYTHKGSVQLTTSVVGAGFKMVNLIISVKDTGIGIKDEDRGKLFESFQRLEEEKNRNIEGAGLGMSITMSLLKQMGGTMDVESVYHQGSTFTVTIPQRVIDGDPMGDFEALMHQKNLVQEKKNRAFTAPEARVLVVDDNDMNLAVSKALLSRTKIQIVTANSGKRCLELAQLEPYNMIFMDHMMPDMDGIETLHELQKLVNSPNAQTPVIALTANALVGARESYIQEGFADFLTKPIDGEQLDQVVLKHLPPELVHFRDDEPAAQPVATSAHGEYQSYGISVDEGLHYSAGNMEVYLDLIAMFLKDNERQKKLQRFLADGNMKDYSILVHALKGNARTLGAQKLADIAFDHEKESKAGNAEHLNATWDELIQAWRTTKEGLALLYQEQRGETIDIDVEDEPEAVESATGEQLVISQEELTAVAELIDQFESEKAVEQLKEWLKHPLDKDLHERVKGALTALEDEFDEGRAMKLLKQES